MQITLNGKPVVIADSINVTRLLSELQLSARVAIEINRQIIPRSTFSGHVIRAGDCVEIIEAVGGG